MKTLDYLLAATLVCALIGCAKSTTPPAADAGHDHKLESLSVGIAQIKGYRDEVKAAFDAGKPSDCDGALHDVAHVLDALPSAGDVASMSAEDQEVVKTASKELFGLFMKIHDGFHGEANVETNAYDAVAADMDKAIETLSSKVAP